MVTEFEFPVADAGVPGGDGDFKAPNTLHSGSCLCAVILSRASENLGFLKPTRSIEQ